MRRASARRRRRRRRGAPCGPAPGRGAGPGSRTGMYDTAAPLRARELPDAVHGVVVVVGEQVDAARSERVGLADQLERPAGVGGEDDLELVLRGVEEAAHRRRAPRGRGLPRRATWGSGNAGCRARPPRAGRDGGGAATRRRGRRRCSRDRCGPAGRGARSRRRAGRRRRRSPRRRGTAAGSPRTPPPSLRERTAGSRPSTGSSACRERPQGTAISSRAAATRSSRASQSCGPSSPVAISWPRSSMPVQVNP